MNVGDKNTEIGYDLGQKVIDAGTKINKRSDANTSPATFICYRVEGAIPADENQRGSKQNFYYFDSKRIQTDDTVSQAIKDACAAFDGATETRADIAAQFNAWLALQPYDEIDLPHQVDEVV